MLELWSTGIRHFYPVYLNTIAALLAVVLAPLLLPSSLSDTAV